VGVGSERVGVFDQVPKERKRDERMLSKQRKGETIERSKRKFRTIRAQNLPIEACIFELENKESEQGGEGE
jgi:hypothetical protein